MEEFRCGYVALVGRPNVGKSTLLNKILGQKISITSRKPQTTRHNILGIYTGDKAQLLFLDTPGIHKGGKKAINAYMNKSAKSALSDADLVLFLVDQRIWTDEDDLVMERVKASGRSCILVVNKIDKMQDRDLLLPQMQSLSSRMPDVEIFPISATKDLNVERLREAICGKMPVAAPLFEEDQITDRPVRFLIAEIIREKIMRQLGDELPYAVTVEIERYKLISGVVHINALVLVEKSGQKSILIGDKGQKLKRIGSDARKDIEALIESRVMLEIWVKTRAGWSDDERALSSLGYQ